MKSPLTETPTQRLNLRGTKIPSQAIVFTGHDTYELAWYHNDKWYDTDPNCDYALNVASYEVVAWEYLPPKPKLKEAN